MEAKLINNLMPLDKRVMHQYGPNVVGIDEVGMGPIAGPMCACALMLDRPIGISRPEDVLIDKAGSISKGRVYVDDSKKLTRKQRETLFPRIESVSFFRLGWVTVEEINATKNIRTSGFLARQRAYDELIKAKMSGPLSLPPHAVISDFFKVETGYVPCIAKPKADAKSFIVACASIIAKVSRDRLMIQLSEKYCQYDFANNVGYGTSKHLQGLKVFGPCSLHRTHFIRNYI